MAADNSRFKEMAQLIKFYFTMYTAWFSSIGKPEKGDVMRVDLFIELSEQISEGSASFLKYRKDPEM